MMESKLEGGGVENGLRKARSSDPKVDPTNPSSTALQRQSSWLWESHPFSVASCHGIQGKGVTGLARLHTSQGETI